MAAFFQSFCSRCFLSLSPSFALQVQYFVAAAVQLSVHVSFSCLRCCLRCAKRFSLYSAVSCCRLLLRCSLISSRRSRSGGVSVENLPRQEFTATCACYSVSFALEIARESTTVNIVSQTMNKHISLHE